MYTPKGKKQFPANFAVPEMSRTQTSCITQHAPCAHSLVFSCGLRDDGRRNAFLPFWICYLLHNKLPQTLQLKTINVCCLSVRRSGLVWLSAHPEVAVKVCAGAIHFQDGALAWTSVVHRQEASILTTQTSPWGRLVSSQHGGGRPRVSALREQGGSQNAFCDQSEVIYSQPHRLLLGKRKSLSPAQLRAIKELVSVL